MLHHLLALLPVVVVLALPAPHPTAYPDIFSPSTATKLGKRDPQLGIQLPSVTVTVPIPTAVTVAVSSVIPSLPSVSAGISVTVGNVFPSLSPSVNTSVGLNPRGDAGHFATGGADGADRNRTAEAADRNSTAQAADRNSTAEAADRSALAGLYLYCTQAVGV